MDFLIGWQRYDTLFNDKPVSCEIRSLKRDAYLVLMSNIAVFKDMSEEQEEVTSDQAKNMMQMVDSFAVFFPKYVRNITGFTINGAAPTPEILIEEAAFSSLVMSIIAQLSVITTLSKEEEKNLEGPPDLKVQENK